VHFD
jgi:hypothetical protein